MTNKPLTKQIGASIKAKRKALGITINDLSKALNITPGYLGLIERGDRGATLSRLLKICDILDYTLDELISDIKPSRDSSPHITRLITVIETENMHNEAAINFLIDIVKSVKKYRAKG